MDHLDSIIVAHYRACPILPPNNFLIQFHSYALLRQRKKLEQAVKINLLFELFDLSVYRDLHLKRIFSQTVTLLKHYPWVIARLSSTSSPSLTARANNAARPDVKLGSCRLTLARPFSSVDA